MPEATSHEINVPGMSHSAARDRSRTAATGVERRVYDATSEQMVAGRNT